MEVFDLTQESDSSRSESDADIAATLSNGLHAQRRQTSSERRGLNPSASDNGSQASNYGGSSDDDDNTATRKQHSASSLEKLVQTRSDARDFNSCSDDENEVQLPAACSNAKRQRRSHAPGPSSSSRQHSARGSDDIPRPHIRAPGPSSSSRQHSASGGDDNPRPRIRAPGPSSSSRQHSARGGDDDDDDSNSQASFTASASSENESDNDANGASARRARRRAKNRKTSIDSPIARSSKARHERAGASLQEQGTTHIASSEESDYATDLNLAIARSLGDHSAAKTHTGGASERRRRNASNSETPSVRKKRRNTSNKHEIEIIDCPSTGRHSPEASILKWQPPWLRKGGSTGVGAHDDGNKSDSNDDDDDDEVDDDDKDLDSASTISVGRKDVSGARMLHFDNNDQVSDHNRSHESEANDDDDDDEDDDECEPNAPNRKRGKGKATYLVQIDQVKEQADSNKRRRHHSSRPPATGSNGDRNGDSSGSSSARCDPLERLTHRNSLTSGTRSVGVDPPNDVSRRVDERSVKASSRQPHTRDTVSSNSRSTYDPKSSVNRTRDREIAAAAAAQLVASKSDASTSVASEKPLTGRQLLVRAKKWAKRRNDAQKLLKAIDKGTFALAESRVYIDQSVHCGFEALNTSLAAVGITGKAVKAQDCPIAGAVWLRRVPWLDPVVSEVIVKFYQYQK
jgi:hypothetical protein